ncbi:DUF837 domain-containing protein, protein [Aphelenchoides besseyi]|nr:DUF837 domain-containing protein, protein [Aphelenchoides besseyi]KAI6218457.1 DUF837 domain-containing protein, protein [Aphelenchoides besseyi]
MSDGMWSDLTENLLSDMRTHVRNLQERVVEAGEVLEQSQGVNEKIAVMREYKDEATTVNSCFRGKDRPGLVRSLQHENRQILALQEENRQMKLALEDVQRGMALIMDKHRKAVRNFERSNALFELVQKRYDMSQKNNVYEKRFYELVDFVDGILKTMADNHAQEVEKYSSVCAENAYLRQALIAKGVNVSSPNLDHVPIT